MKVLSNFTSGLKKYFFTGLLVILPISVTVYVLMIAVKFLIKSMPKNLLVGAAPYLGIQNLLRLKYFNEISSFIITFVFIILIGYFFSNYAGKKVLRLWEKLLNKLPGIRLIYGFVKRVLEQIIESFRMENREMFKHMVLVEYPRKGIYSIGFISSESHFPAPGDTEEKTYNIFMPTTPNPTSGILIVAPESQIKRIDMKFETAMKFIISLGIIHDK